MYPDKHSYTHKQILQSKIKDKREPLSSIFIRFHEHKRNAVNEKL